MCDVRVYIVTALFLEDYYTFYTLHLFSFVVCFATEKGEGGEEGEFRERGSNILIFQVKRAP